MQRAVLLHDRNGGEPRKISSDAVQNRESRALVLIDDGTGERKLCVPERLDPHGYGGGEQTGESRRVPLCFGRRLSSFRFYRPTLLMVEPDE
jgi:hypothetical protein